MSEEKLQEIQELEARLDCFIDPSMSIDKKIKILENSYWRAHNAGYCDYMAGQRMAGVDDEQVSQHDLDCKHKYDVERLLELLHEQRFEDARRLELLHEQKFEDAWQEIENGFEQDKEKAFAAWLELSNEGHGHSARTVAWCYQNGEGTERDLSKAKEFYRLAAQRGYLYSYADLYWVALEEENSEEALEILFEGARNGSAACCEILACECFDGKLFGGNLKVMAYLATRAYELDKTYGTTLALCYLNAWFFPQVYSYAKYCMECSGRLKKDLESNGNRFPDYWDEIEPIPPSYPEFDITLDDCQAAENPLLLIEKAQDFMNATPNDFESAKPLVIRAAKAGYSRAMYFTYLLNTEYCADWLVLGANGYGNLECIDELASLFSDCAFEHTKDPYLSEASHFWNLRKRLHPKEPMRESIAASYEKYLKMINEAE